MDSKRARDAFEELRSQLDQVTEPRRPNVDIEKAAALAAAIGRTVQEPAVRAVFAQLPASVFDMRHIDVLEKAALATWHAVIEHRDAAVRATQARVPADTLEQAGELKQLMLRVVDYHLRDDHAALIADIQSGKGYADLASDLVRLGKLYESNHPRLALDRVHYRPEDAARASELAHRIYAHLGDQAESDERTWADYAQRAWTFLLETYEEVRAAGRFLYRHDKGDERFPSLISSQRQPANRSSNGQPAAEAKRDAETKSDA